MSSAPLALPRRSGATAWTGPIVDVDVHAHVPSHEVLLPYMEPVWRRYAAEKEWGGPNGVRVAYPPNLPSTVRPEWRPADGRVAASSVELLREHVLDPLDVSAAIVNCYYAVETIRHPDFAAAVARAVNDWLIAEWLEKDPRLRVSIVVPGRDPEAAAREIDRVGAHPGVVQVLAPVRGDRLYGNRAWRPMLAAIERHDLVMGLHFGGTSEGAPSVMGWPSWYAEEYAAETHAVTAQITSMVAGGSFQSHPDLRVGVLELGFSYLPQLMWSLDREWYALRFEVPWLDRRPSAVMRDHLRFSIAPMDLSVPSQIARILEWIDSDEMLMFATDYPHMHDDDLGLLLGEMSDQQRSRLMAGVATDWYRL